jgi:hypothetical protein
VNELTGHCRKLNNKELHMLYSLQGIIKMIKSRRIRWVGHEWRSGTHIGYLWESQKERDHWEDQDVGSWILLRWILDR